KYGRHVRRIASCSGGRRSRRSLADDDRRMAESGLLLEETECGFRAPCRWRVPPHAPIRRRPPSDERVLESAWPWRRICDRHLFRRFWTVAIAPLSAWGLFASRLPGTNSAQQARKHPKKRGTSRERLGTKCVCPTPLMMLEK